MNGRSLLEQVLEAWRVNSAINLKLVSAIPKKGFDAVPLASCGRTVAKQLAHMQKVHSGWLKHNGARLSRDARPLDRNAKLDRNRCQIALALKQNGMRLPDKVALGGIWYSWYGGNF